MEKGYKPYVPASSNMTEFTIRAIVIGLIMSVVLGAANAYLGLKAGMTIAATYPAAVIGMALLRLWKGKNKGSILEENIARTIGSIGESVAAGAIFTLPAFIISGLWKDLLSPEHYMICVSILLVGGLMGIMFVTILRRAMVDDHDLPFPESVAASEIHKAGQSGVGGAGILLQAMGIGALIKILGEAKLYAASWERFFPFQPSSVKLALNSQENPVHGTGGIFVTTPGVSPAYMGVGYIIGPVLACLNFSGGLLAWGLFVPLVMWLLGPDLSAFIVRAGGTEAADMGHMATQIWKLIVRPIAIGGMLVSAIYTLYNMRASLVTGLKRAVTDIQKAAGTKSTDDRTEQDLNFKLVLALLALAFVGTVIIYHFFITNILTAIIVAIVMIIVGFLFAAVSGYLVGLIGSSNNPISGLTIATVVIAALLMVLLKAHGDKGVAAVLGVAAVICVSAAVAGEMLQDLKVGHILGGTPWRMQFGDIIGIIPSAFVMVLVLALMHQGDLNAGGAGLGGKTYTAPQAGLMAMLARGIVGGDMTWGLIIIGMIMGVAFILIKVKSPMLVSVGMYLPFETTAAIFIGGMVKWVVDFIIERKGASAKIKEAAENTGVLVASGLIAGEALIGLGFAALNVVNVKMFEIFQSPNFGVSILVILLVAYALAVYPIKNVSELLAAGPAPEGKKAEPEKEDAKPEDEEPKHVSSEEKDTSLDTKSDEEDKKDKEE